jgi:hypothetical protein
MSENLKKKKAIEVNELYADYEIIWGDPSTWSEEIVAEFDEKLSEIGRRYKCKD